jgi:hypothetical protein
MERTAGAVFRVEVATENLHQHERSILSAMTSVYIF